MTRNYFYSWGGFLKEVLCRQGQFSLLLAFVFVLAACQSGAMSPENSTPKPKPTYTVTRTPTPISTTTPTLTATSTEPVKSNSIAAQPPELMPTLTATPDPSAVPIREEEPQLDASDPLFIGSLRRYGTEPAPTIEILKTLAEKEQFTRFQIAYLSDGLRITGVMNVPKSDDHSLVDAGLTSIAANPLPRWPVILLNHGHYDPSNYYPGKGTELEVAYLATHGYVTIASDYRAYADSEGNLGGHFDPG